MAAISELNKFGLWIFDFWLVVSVLWSVVNTHIFYKRMRDSAVLIDQKLYWELRDR